MSAWTRFFAGPSSARSSPEAASGGPRGKNPFVRYTFRNAQDARDALLELPCIHPASDARQPLTEGVIFGYYAVDGAYDAVVCGDAMTVEDWEQAKSTFARYGGRWRNGLEPTRGG